MSARSVFFGTPELAVPALEALAQITDVVAVVCQPDRKVGRGLELRAPPVKRRAEELGILVHQPTKVRT
ncbi:MAG: methionyl-tRNA formyltransferase, partial [Polyangiaceae bacterium]